jgi:DNA-binding NtrC family response regulator
VGNSKALLAFLPSFIDEKHRGAYFTMTFVKPRRSMLVIDDDSSILRVFSRIFERKGYTVVTAQTGKEAQEKLEETQYDVTLVDLTLPDMNGADLLPEMKKTAPKMIRIVLTGLSTENASYVLEKGADVFLEKPVQPQFLIDLLEEKLKGKTF